MTDKLVDDAPNLGSTIDDEMFLALTTMSGRPRAVTPPVVAVPPAATSVSVRDAAVEVCRLLNDSRTTAFPNGPDTELAPG